MPFDRRTTILALVVLTVLTLTKNAYMAAISNYFVLPDPQIRRRRAARPDPLFVFLGAAAVGCSSAGRSATIRRQIRDLVFDRQALPFALLLPYADFTWTIVLSLLIGIIISSCFPAIVVFAQELMPGQVGMVAGIFGFAFGIGGIAAAALGALADARASTRCFR
jgi:FSR family fosmidomycin resistance protein-like MFS transporter